jgi:hypothetical protein
LLGDLVMSEKSRLAVLCLAFILLGLIVGVKSAQTASPFTPGPGSPITTGAGSTFVATGDLNGDGKPDVVVVNSGTAANSISILLATGGGGFTAPVNITVGPSPADVAIGDVNGDGRPDLVVTNQGNDTISVLLNVGGGAFAAPTTLVDFAGSFPEGVAIADVNHDGANDIIVTNSGGNSVTLYLGAGFGTFAPPVKISTSAPPSTTAGGSPSGVAVADYNNDGNLDLATSNNDGSATILLGNGDGTFKPAVNINLTPSATSTCGDPDAIVSADLNTDAKQDIAIACTGGTVSILLGNGDGTFQTPVSYSTISGTAGSGPEAIAVGDFDGKNGLDVVIADTSNAAVILLNNGNGTFAPPGTTTTTTACATAGNGAFGVSAADFNGDGKPDLAVANSIDGTVSILLNGGAVGGGAGCSTSGGGGGGGGGTANFTVVVTPPSVTTTAGTLVTYTVTVTPGPGFSEAVALTCTSAAPASGCSLNPKSVTPRGGPVTSTLSVATNFTSAGGAQFGRAEPPPPLAHPGKALYAALSLGGAGIVGLVLVPASRGKNRRRRIFGLVITSLLVVLMLITLQACGGHSGISQKTPKGTFSITAVGTVGSGASAQTASGSASLVVQ